MQHTNHLAHPKYRRDIDGLRAIAVLSVVGFHAFPSLIPGGFVGVDIFFVISGFLITTILLENLHTDRFRFLEFYQRRVRRIFPALAVVLAATYVLGWGVLLAVEFKELGKHIAGGAGFVSNFILWSEKGYFDQSAATKPLLHLWSLGIEEQFYLFWPLLLGLAWRKRLNVLVLTALVAATSFMWNLAIVHSDAAAAFYSPQSRIWELLVGSLLAYASLFHAALLAPSAQSRANVRSITGAALLCAAILLTDQKTPFPGWFALLPTVGTALMISAGSAGWVNRMALSNRVAVWFGLISYPLYLWHWPLLSYAQIVEYDPSRALRAGLVVAAVLLAWLTYTLVEKPLRFGGNAATKSVALCVIIGALGLMGYTTYARRGFPERTVARISTNISEALADIVFKSTKLENGRITGTKSFAGQTSESVVFAGDSLMGVYYSRVAAIYADGMATPYYSAVYASRTDCRPLPFTGRKSSENVRCDDYYKAAMALAKESTVRKIILGGNWQAAFTTEYKNPASLPTFIADIRELRALGKEVILVGMAPHSREFDPMVIARPYRLDFSGTAQQAQEIWLNRKSLEKQDAVSFDRLNQVARETGAIVVNPYDYLCTQDKCPSVVNGQPLYRDDFHLRASTGGRYATFMDEIVKKRR